MTDGIVRFLERHGKVPLAWAGSTSLMNYANLGDALSPVMVALCTGFDVARVPMKSETPRLAAVGTIGHAFAGGEVYFWGTGCSNVLNPSGADAERTAYRPPADTRIHIGATRGPHSERLLTGDKGGPTVYGDPVWLLPRFYRPKVVKRWKLGVIMHLSELADRNYEAHPKHLYRRFEIPPSLTSSVRLLNTVTPISTAALRARIDEILACEQIVSTSLHGMVLAEAYGIPCLYFGAREGPPGLTRISSSADSDLDLRILDLYGGLGQRQVIYYNQDRKEPTDWEKLVDSITMSWEPKSLDEDLLLGALPLPYSPVGGSSIVIQGDASVFELPLIANLQLQHDVGLLREEDASRTKTGDSAGRSSELRGGIMRKVFRRMFQSGAA